MEQILHALRLTGQEISGGSAALLVATLFDRRDVRPAEIRRIKQLIARHEKEVRE